MSDKKSWLCKKRKTLQKNEKKTSLKENGELITWFDKLELSVSFFPFIEKLSLLFAQMCLPVCKPEAAGGGIAIRAKVEQKRGLFFISGKT